MDAYSQRCWGIWVNGRGGRVSMVGELKGS